MAAPGEMQKFLEPILGRVAGGRHVVVTLSGGATVSGTVDHADKRSLFLRADDGILVCLPKPALESAAIQVTEPDESTFVLDKTGGLRALGVPAGAVHNSDVFTEVREYSGWSTLFTIAKILALAALAVILRVYGLAKTGETAVESVTQTIDEVKSFEWNDYWQLLWVGKSVAKVAEEKKQRDAAAAAIEDNAKDSTEHPSSSSWGGWLKSWFC